MKKPTLSDTGVVDFDSDFDNHESSDEAQLLDTECDHDGKAPTCSRHKLLLCTTKQRRYIAGIVATSSLGSFLWGYNFSVIAGAMLLIDDHFNLSVLWHEAIVSVLVGGATVGAAIAGTLNDKFGRWKVMMLSAILNVVAAVVMAFAFSETFLVIGRTVAGFAIGIYCVLRDICMFVCIELWSFGYNLNLRTF